MPSATNGGRPRAESEKAVMASATHSPIPSMKPKSPRRFVMKAFFAASAAA